MATKSDNFKPTGKKLLMAKKLADPEFTGTITQLCEEIGVARSTFYDWVGNSDFRDYTESLIDKYTDSELSRVWKALMGLIDMGNIQAIKLYFELKGKYKEGSGAIIKIGCTQEDDPLSKALMEEAGRVDNGDI